MSISTSSEPATSGEHARQSYATRAREWYAQQNRIELAAWGLLILVTLGLRLYDLGARPFHHDESQDAYFSWTFAETGKYTYDPLLHGPFRFFLTAGLFTLFGDSDFTARLLPALAGTVLVALPFFLRLQLGKIAAFAAAVLFAIGPSFLYYSRFAREDITFAALTLALIVVVWRYLERPTFYGPSLILGLVAAMFACKENAFISMAVAGAFFIPAAFIRSTGVWSAISRRGPLPWICGVFSFLFVWCLFFGVFFTQWRFRAEPREFPVTCSDGTVKTLELYGGVKGGFVDGISYWLAQQCVERGGESPLLYAGIMLGDEWPTVLLALVGAIWVLRHRSVMRMFLIFAFVGQMVIYMYASERFAWLVLHPLLPLVLLAGLGIQKLWLSRMKGVVVAGILVIALLGTGVASYQANVQYPSDPREMLVTTQTAPDVKRAVDEVRRRRDRPSILVDSNDGGSFPYAWYFRREDAKYVDLTAPAATPTADFVFASEAGNQAILDKLGAYRGVRQRFRGWWVRDWAKATPGAWWGYVARREPFNPPGGLYQWFYEKR